ncbi:hypothetical protein RHGRI_018347 [Rhododendron griersonianum]|uniref:Uncharacterized protein n=1 Tax=Rhododendron griersonianum TaxID=479676 RepID=A0AAV6K194_9ERIC|nr:hypothetical protein RHGRI_018347 [Rhododendron griersonianum]
MPLLNSSIWQDFHMTWVYQGHIPEGAIMSCFSNCFGKEASPPKHTIDIDEASLIKASDKVPYDSEVSGIQNVKLYTYRELSIATGGFSPANKVGQGGFGSVYKVWELYERGELPELVDKTLEGDYDVDEACKFFKIGLLCTQDMAKIRPSMSEVVKMLTGEMHVDGAKISKPGLISELMGLKRKKDSSDLISGDSKKMGDSSLGSRDATCATMTFTSISARSD